MSNPAEEVVLDVVEELVEEVVEDVVDLSPAEEEAMKHGWKPQDTWEGPEEDFINAPEFNRRAELFDKIARQSKEIRDVNDKFTQLAAMQSKVAEKAKQELLTSLKQEKVEALANDDYEKVVELDEKIAEEKQVSVDVVDAPKPNPIFDSWVRENTWYKEDDELAELADAFGQAYSQKEVKRGRSPSSITMDELLEYVDTKMSRQIPKAEIKKTPSAVEGAGKSTSKQSKKSTKSKHSASDLSPDQVSLMRGIMQADPDMTEKQYIDDLVAIGELK